MFKQVNMSVTVDRLSKFLSKHQMQYKTLKQVRKILRF